ncbi:MAG: hypothetical protein WCG47_00030 [Dermatophilaceae bacterium]
MSVAGAAADPFSGSRACLEELIGWLEGTEAAGLTHAQLEEQLDRRGRELLRRMYQGQLDLRALRERRAQVTDAEGVRHGAVETDHVRPLSTLFGTVEVTRFAYRHRGHANLYPADALAQPAGRAALAWDQEAGRGRGQQGLVRGGSRCDQSGDGHRDR